MRALLETAAVGAEARAAGQGSAAVGGLRAMGPLAHAAAVIADFIGVATQFAATVSRGTAMAPFAHAGNYGIGGSGGEFGVFIAPEIASHAQQ